MPEESPLTTQPAEGLESSEPKQASFDYAGYIEGNNFGEYAKCASDMAALLNDPHLEVSG